MSYRRKHIKPKIRNLRPKRNILKMRLFWFAMIIILLLGVATYFILFDSRLSILKIEISGNEKTKSNDIKNIVLTKSSSRFILVDKKNLSKSILNNFPAVEIVMIKKKFPNEIIIEIKERKPFGVFCRTSGTDCFLIDLNGVIFEPLKSVPENMIILRSDQIDKEIFDGEIIINKNIMSIISKIMENLKNNFQLDVKEVFVANPLVLKTSENWQIYFDPESDINLQITKMNSLLKDEIPLNIRKNIQYIYLQYKDRAYYK